MQFCSKNLTHFTNLDSLKIKKFTLATQPKTLIILQIFQDTCFWFMTKKKHLHCTISGSSRTAFSKHLESKCLYIPARLCKKIFASET